MDFTLRKAVELDDTAIKRLVRESRINPTGLDWRRFVVAETADGTFAGCGQLKPHGDGTLELASLVVAPVYRGQGLAAKIIRHLSEQAPRPLYLTCRHPLEPFYKKYGFRVVEKNRLPRYFARISRLAGVINSIGLVRDRMLVMVLE